MHNDKDSRSMTTPQKRQRKEAKKRKPKLMKVEEKGGRYVVDSMHDLIANGEPTLSHGGPDLTPNTMTMMARLDRAHSSDSEEE